MSVARNTLVQSALTLSSRMLGFVRDVLLAGVIGAGPIGDAWATALIFPNLFRRIFAEGAFASAFVPTYARTLESDGPEAARQVASEALKVLFAFTALITIVAQVFMPWVLLIIHGGQADDPQNYDLAVFLTRITMPYLTFMSLTALFSGVLNSGQRFVFSAGAPLFLNICLIVAVFFASDPYFGYDFSTFRGWKDFIYGSFTGGAPVETAKAVAWATLIAGVLQALLLYWGCVRQNVNIGLIGLPRLTPRVKKVLSLAIPGTIAASGTQINILVSQSLASYEDGAKSLLYYADRLYQLPLGLIGVAVGIAILPRLSRSARANDDTGGRRTMDEGIGLALALVMPAAVALYLAPGFLLEGIFARGAFTTENAYNAGLALQHFAWGVPAFVLIKVLAPAFFAREDTKTPMRFALVSVIINTLLGAGLFFWLKGQGVLGFPGLAIATSIAAWVNVLLLALTLIRRDWYRPGPVLISRVIRAALACVVMGAVLIAVLHNEAWFRQLLLDRKIVMTLLFIAAGGATYGVAALAFGAVKLSDIKGALRRS